MDLMKINIPRLRLGIAALRSGLYKKGVARLHRRNSDGIETWCCLGVLSDVAIRLGNLDLERTWHEDGNIGDDRIVREVFDGNNMEYLCESVQEFYGLDTDSPRLTTPDGRIISASLWNDSGWATDDKGESVYEEDFTAIADGFERLADEAEAAQAQ